MKQENELYNVWQVEYELNNGITNSIKFMTQEQAEKEIKTIKALEPTAVTTLEEITVTDISDVWEG